ncbi:MULTISPECIES: sensor histidine kinase [Aminobacterium]|uniref:sensor histidine kinase n=1 Tax=Aminobacterium TaxID=81466 RepID=UPI00257B9C14|nr:MULTISPECIES: HAMP domain-containing sensor histidine kinase [unclassified Aminobacterium]
MSLFAMLVIFVSIVAGIWSYKTGKIIIAHLFWAVTIVILTFLFCYWHMELRFMIPLRKVAISLHKQRKKEDHVRIPFLGEQPVLVELRNNVNDLLNQYDESMAQLKQLSADTSHELRTPLSVIKGKIEIALMTPREPQYYQQKFEEIRMHVDNMQQIVEAILELSRFSKFAGPEWMEPIDLLMAADEACENMAPLIKKSRHQILKQKLSFAPVFGSLDLLTRVVSNLLDNASKYTPEGGTIGVETWSDIKKQKAYLRVWDTGQGMDEYAIQKCRDLFWRADTARTGGGYGLGLSLVQRIAELHRAQMDIQSTIGKGSSFTLAFKLDSNALSDYDTY